MSAIFDYLPGDSFIHRLNPMTKIILSIALCASCFITDSHALVAAIIILCLVLSAASGTFPRTFKTFIALSKLAAFMFVVQVLFIREGNVLFRLPFGIPVTGAGVSFSLLFAMRLVAATLPLSFVLSVTEISDVGNVFVRYLFIPYKYAFALTTAIHFIPFFAGEMTSIMEAQTARGVEFDTRNFVKKIRLILPLCVPLLISSVKKIENGALSAELRGFNLRTRDSGYKRYRFRAADIFVLVCCAALISVCAFF
jgi:energy-coupling factor transport system permease protein